MAAGWAALPWIFGRARPGSDRGAVWLWRRGVAGALALSGTALAAMVSDRYINANDVTLALSLTPVVVAIAVCASRVGEGHDLTARLWPGLMGLAGLLLLLPQPALSGWRFVLALCLMPAVIGTAAAIAAPVGVHGEEVRGRALPWKVVALLGAGAMFVAVGLVERRTGSSLPLTWEAAVLDGVTALLSLMALSRLGATRWSAQFLVVPLLTMLEGAAILRPVLDVRSWLAFALLALSGAYLFRVGREGRRAAGASTLV